MRWAVGILCLSLHTGVFCILSAAEPSALAAGPFIGYILPDEAALVVDSQEEAVISVELREAGDPAKREVQTQVTRVEDNFRVTFVFSGLHADTNYRYETTVNGEVPEAALNGKFRTPPALGKSFFRPYRIAFAGVRAENDRAEPKADALPALARSGADAIIWTGGQQPIPRQATPTPATLHRSYRSLFEETALAPLLRSAAQYSVWSRLEAGKPVSGSRWIFRDLAAGAFCDSLPRPVCGHPAFGGTASQVRIGPVEFFFLDAVTFHTPGKQGTARAFGEAQLAWLLEALAASEAPFRIVVAGRSLLTPVDAAHTWRFASGERSAFLEALRRAEIPGVFFITGGAPAGEMTRAVRPGTYPLHELTIGPVRLSADQTAAPAGLNYDRMPGTRAEQAHFALVEFSGDPSAPSMTISVIDASGESLWRDTFRAAELLHREASQRSTP